jgi:quinol monooxygenase YgiN
MVYVLARITVKAEAAGAVRGILSMLATQSRQEAGCLSYDVYQQAEGPHVFQTVEQWRDKAAADAHMKTAHVGAALTAATPLLAGAPEILAYDKLS